MYLLVWTQWDSFLVFLICSLRRRIASLVADRVRKKGGACRSIKNRSSAQGINTGTLALAAHFGFSTTSTDYACLSNAIKPDYTMY